MHTTFSRSDGFTLVELIVAFGMLSLLALGVVNLSKLMTRSNAKNQFDSEVTLITNEINQILSDPSRCVQVFGPAGTKSALSTAVTNIMSKYYTQSSGSAPADGYGNGKVSINSYLFNTTLPELALNQARLTINFNTKKIISSNPIKKVQINMHVIVDSTNNILSCRSLSKASTDIWTRATSSSNIYYSGGNVGINNSSPASPLDVAGDIRASGGGRVMASNFLYTSDVSLKENVETLSNALDKTLKVRGVSFNWKSTKSKDIGFIAQEIQSVIPEVVSRDERRGILVVDYARVIPLLVEAIKIQNIHIGKLDERIKYLENNN